MKRLVLATLLAAAPAAAVGIAPLAIAGDKAHAPEVSLDELKKIVAAKSATIIDVNGADSYAKGHIPTAISFAKASGNFAAVLPKDKSAPIVAYCGGPLCTAWEDAAKAAKDLGYSNIKHFKGGIKGWTAAGQAVEKS